MKDKVMNFIDYIKKFTSKKMKAMFITPPLLEPNTYYLAMPLIVGQLISKGYDAENFDLNIKFFRTVLTKEYLTKTIKILKKKNIEYDSSNPDFLLNNIDNAVEEYLKNKDEDSKQILCNALKFISLQSSVIRLSRLDGFEHCFSNVNYRYSTINALTYDEQNNFFIDFFKPIIKEIKQKGINFIGITIPFPGTIIPALTLARLLKENTNIFVALGGNFLKSESILAHPDILGKYCDVVQIGDGEESTIELAEFFENKRKIEDVSGLIYKQKNKVLFNPPKLINSMKDIANISLQGLNINEYFNKHFVYLMLSKGCYWGKCTFCGLGPKYKRYITMSPEQAVQYILDLKKEYNKNNCDPVFLFQDDALSPSYLNKLSDELVKQNANIHYTIFARFEKEFTREFLDKLSKSGLGCVYWGLESGCQSVLDSMNKGITLENAERILKDSYELGIMNMAGLIINFPTETMEEYNETLAFVERVKNYVTLSPGEYAVMKDSIVEQNCDKYGIKIYNYNRSEFSYCPDFDLVRIPQKERKYKWAHFCECLKNGEYKVDSNKHL